jgi:LuxR family maltose regulon positive regulatory protein
LDVLRLIGEGLSNPQIAKQLIVAIGTIKAHTNNIFRKLNVTNRVQAVTRARELHLL